MMNLEISSQSYDLNVTPDKRQIFLHNEQLILQFIREKMDGYINSFGGCINVNESQTSSIQEDLILPTSTEIGSSDLMSTAFSSNSSQSILSTQSGGSLTVNTSSSLPSSWTNRELNSLSLEKKDPSEVDLGSPLLVSRQSRLQTMDVPIANSVQGTHLNDNLQNRRVSCEYNYDLIQKGFRQRHLSSMNSKMRTNILHESLPNTDSIPCLWTAENISLAGIHQLQPEVAENELSRVINKEDFEAMEIIGQFNLGFIIVKQRKSTQKNVKISKTVLADYDLFIVDQHAADEKYNFERFMRETIIESQPLIQPLILELSPSEEAIIAENMAIFNKNGFQFDVDMSNEPTKRIKLACQPYSQTITFGKSDIEELIATIIETGGIYTSSSIHSESLATFRCSRVRAMLASRACRKSVMIGMPLDHKQMIKVNDLGLLN